MSGLMRALLACILVGCLETRGGLRASGAGGGQGAGPAAGPRLFLRGGCSSSGSYNSAEWRAKEGGGASKELLTMLKDARAEAGQEESPKGGRKLAPRQGMLTGWVQRAPASQNAEPAADSVEKHGGQSSDDASRALADLRALLPPSVPNDQLAQLLSAHNGDVQRAANACLDLNEKQEKEAPRPQAVRPPRRQNPRSQDAPGRRPPASSSAAASVEPSWEQQIGDLTVYAYTTRPVDKHSVPLGCPVKLSRPKVPRAGSKRALEQLAANTIIRLSFDLAPLAMHGECGRIPSSDCRILAPLIDAGAVILNATCIAPPESSKVGSNVLLSVRVTLTRAALQLEQRKPFVGLIHELFLRMGLQPAVPSSMHTNATDEVLAEDDSSAVAEDQAGVGQDVRLAMDAGGNWSTASNEMPRAEPSEQFASELRPYQAQGLWWMLKRERTGLNDTQGKRGDGRGDLHALWSEYRFADGCSLYLKCTDGEIACKRPSASPEPKGGILADDMGLGKTVQILALMSLDKTSPHDQWHEAKQRNASLGGTLVICPTSILPQWLAEARRHMKPGTIKAVAYYGSERNQVNSLGFAGTDLVLTTYGTLSSEYDGGRLKGPLYKTQWCRVVLDEAHIIKQHRTAGARAVFALEADRRWSLTGTPVQNALEDLYSQLAFLRMDPWSDHAWWNRKIVRPALEGDKSSITLLQNTLRPLLLRRTKGSVEELQGSQLNLPKRNDAVMLLDLSIEERDVYTSLRNESETKFDAYMAEGKVLSNYASILEMLLRLRQCCVHPFLVLSRGDTGSGHASDLDRLMPKLLGGNQSAGSRALLKQWMAGWSGDGRPLSQADSSSIAGARGNVGYVGDLIESLKSGKHMDCPVCLEGVYDAVVTPCGHVFCRECINHVVASPYNNCPTCRAKLTRQSLMTVPRANRFLVDIKADWRSSTKVDTLIRELQVLGSAGGGKAREDIVGERDDGAEFMGDEEDRQSFGVENGVASKSVVFSQWTAFLDLLEVALERSGIPFSRLDGSLPMQQRTTVLSEFESSRTCGVLLMSIKAGGQGLNLCFCQNVFLMDPWWNPHLEEQAIARVHRIGQTRPVNVRRLIVRDTVEESILEMHERKRGLAEDALGIADVVGASPQERTAERLRDLHRLFRADNRGSTTGEANQAAASNNLEGL